MTDSAKRHRPDNVLDRKVVAAYARGVSREPGLIYIARFDLMAFRTLQRPVLGLAMREGSLFPRYHCLPVWFDLRLQGARGLEPNRHYDRQRRQPQQSNSSPQCFQPALPKLAPPLCKDELDLPLPLTKLMAVATLNGSLLRSDVTPDAQIVISRFRPLFIPITALWILGVPRPSVTSRAFPQLRSASNRVLCVMAFTGRRALLDFERGIWIRVLPGCVIVVIERDPHPPPISV